MAKSAWEWSGNPQKSNTHTELHSSKVYGYTFQIKASHRERTSTRPYPPSGAVRKARLRSVWHCGVGSWPHHARTATPHTMSTWVGRTNRSLRAATADTVTCTD
eukprot:103450-Prymnesium_polylepis.1